MFSGLVAASLTGVAGVRMPRRVRRRVMRNGTDEFRIFRTEDGEEFEIFPNEVLGAGAQGTVYRGVRRSTSEAVAVKVIPTWRLMLEEAGEEKVATLEAEFAMLRRMGKHPNIAGMIADVDIFGKQGKLLDFPRYKLMVMDIVEGKELAEHVAFSGPLNEPVARHIFLQVVEALHYMHEMGVIHRDLKPENVLVTGDEITMESEAKLVDFGVAKCVNDGPLKTVVGTPGYMAPEIARVKLQYVATPASQEGGVAGNSDVATFSWGAPAGGAAPPTAVNADPFGLEAKAAPLPETFCPKIDVWSAGVVLYTCLTGKLPFKSMLEIIESDYLRCPLSNCSAEAQELLTGMLEKDPEKRMSMEQVLDHPWMGCSADDSCTIPWDDDEMDPWMPEPLPQEVITALNAAK